uniref:non-specific serine/threonine protein kinase n=1 Tax=Kalanchoe fedtschenkoi TaxID=63787 RepID=A0A7N0RJJ6_KALFE
MSSQGSLNDALSKPSILGLKLWVLICIGVCVFIVFILCILLLWVTFRKKSRSYKKFNQSRIPDESKDIRVDRAGAQNSSDRRDSVILNVNDHSSERASEKMAVHLGRSASNDPDNLSQCSSIYHHERALSSQSGEEGNSGGIRKQSSSTHAFVAASPLVGLPEGSHLGWGHWFTLRDLEYATNRFSPSNVIGEGGYGVVYRGRLVNGTAVAVKKILNNLGQAEKEFRVEVEAIGHVRHKNLVRLLGYCIEGVQRMLVYEYVNNGNLEQWLHGSLNENGGLTWEARMKIVTGIARALAYLHESIEPKVIHRDIKASNILLDHDFNGKLSDFGLAKLLDSGESHINTRVMGTYGYVAPEYANTGLLNEKSDVYSFGVLFLEVITGRDPVDHSRPAKEVNLVEWFKMMVGCRRADEVVDPVLEVKPATRALKRVLLVALRCVDPDSEKRPKMSRVVQMLESDEFPMREDRRNRKTRTASMEIEAIREITGSAEIENKITESEDHTTDRHD